MASTKADVVPALSSVQGPQLCSPTSELATVGDIFLFGRPRRALSRSWPPNTGHRHFCGPAVAPRGSIGRSPLPSIRPPKFRGVQEMSHVKRPKKVPRIGEHMSAVTLPDGTTPDIFASGSGEEMATGLGVPLLGPIPLSPGLGEGEMLFRTGPLPVHTPLSPVATAESEASFRCPRSKLSPPAKQLLRG